MAMELQIEVTIGPVKEEELDSILPYTYIQ